MGGPSDPATQRRLLIIKSGRSAAKGGKEFNDSLPASRKTKVLARQVSRIGMTT
jgi:hypothetical protein